MLKKISLFIILSLISLTCFALKTSTTVLTLNLANYNGHPHWSDRLNLIVDAIENAHADVVVLQEVRFDPDEPSSKTDYENMAEQVLRKLQERGDFINAELVNQPIMFYPTSAFNAHSYPLPAGMASNTKSYLWEGISIISKVKILETGSVFLSKPLDCTDTNKRATQYVKLDTPNKPLYIANIHFGLGTICVINNARETLTYLQRFLASDSILMMGDFNVTPDNIALKEFSQAGLTDVWAKLHPSEKGYTAPADKPTKRIDYIWANNVMMNKLTSSEQLWIIADNAKDGLYPSDHLGLALTF